MKHNIISFSALLLISFMLSCTSEDLTDLNIELPADVASENLVLKSTRLQPDCDPAWIPLFSEKRTTVGNLVVSNRDSKLEIEFVPGSSYSIREVQLWIGTDPKKVPKNRKNIPIPGKFDYKTSGQSTYTFSIKLSDIYDIPEMLLEGKVICIFAHALLLNKQTSKLFSAWSAGTTFGVKRWGTYSTYVCCHPTGGGGCFPHNAYCGKPIDGINYLQIASSNQKIYADNGEIIGNTYLSDGKIYFNFYQDWMLEDSEANIEIAGLNSLDKQAIAINDFIVERELGNFIIEVPKYNYYQVNLNVQYCTTGN
ncbi:hypothetical protein [Draconibacterium halophilum]|uniref:Uncharacterized protein n=1 Tax=Draconibacterium halophilum TaxID=2706887 RepID=A0A6C0RB94_9BACT|nr:hypothetical protein [Draconibacterium halophilum]QIA07908.1 hypothetical protein G0Q07_09290 [Draconibacterium halophilum]